MCCATLRGMPSSFRPAEVLFQERALVLFYAWLLPTDRWLLVAPFACISLVRSLTWSISDVKHVSGCGGRDPLRPMPDVQTTEGRDVRRPILSASCWQLRYMSVSRHWRVEATRTCRADHCEEWETTSSSFCVGCGSYSTCQLRNVVAWRRRPVSPCRSLWSGGDRIGRPGHHHSDSDEGRHVGAKTDKGAASSNAFMWTASSGSRHAAR